MPIVEEAAASFAELEWLIEQEIESAIQGIKVRPEMQWQGEPAIVILLDRIKLSEAIVAHIERFVAEPELDGSHT